MKVLQALISFVGRLCISALFIVEGLRIFLNWQSAEQSFAATLCDWLNMSLGDERFRPLFEMAINASSFILVTASTFAIVGGLLVLFGMSVRLGAFILLCIFIPSTLLFHHFWTYQEAECEMQFSLFIKNMSIIGGLLLLLAYGRGTSKKSKKAKAKTGEDA